MTIWLLISVAIVAITFSLKALRMWLERQAINAQAQGELVEEYYECTTRFLRLSDSKKHAELREMIAWAGANMLRSSTLVRGLLFAKIRKRTRRDAPRTRTEDPFKGLSEDATHAFARALATALLVSSYQSICFGWQYRAMLQLVMKPKEKELAATRQVVGRLRDFDGHNGLNGHSGLAA